MALSITHTFVSAVPDGADTSAVRPSNWNATHTISGTVDTIGVTTGTSLALGGATLGTNELAVAGNGLVVGDFAGAALYVGPAPASSWTAVLSANALRLGQTKAITWSSTDTNPGSGNADLSLYRDAANTLAQRNGTNAQTFRVYGTESSSLTNYERLSIGYGVIAAGTFNISVQQAGTGSARALYIGTEGANGVLFRTNATTVWQFTSAGHLLTVADNTYDIGASGATRPRTIYAGTSIVSPLATLTLLTVTSGTSAINQISLTAGNYLIWSTRSRISSPSDGVLTLDVQAGGDFGRLQFGGTTSSFPSLKRSTTTIAVRLADDSGDAGISASTGAFSGAVSLGNTVNSVSPTAPDRTVTIVIGGTTYYLHAKTTND
jgi:hypothetical protein